MVKSILLVGVGGQGTILAGKILTSGLLESGIDVKMSEIHGMSQRGGSVSTHVRYGEKVESPVIEIGGADTLVGFELMETYRWLEYLKPSGNVIVNNYRINPVPVLIGKREYANNLLDLISEKTKTVSFDAFNESVKIGDSRAMNLLLLGSVVKIAGLTSIDWNSIIEKEVRKQFVDLNKKAFARGLELAE